MPQTRDQTRLLVPRKDAQIRLKERIDKAIDIVPNEIRSPDDLAKAEARQKRWHDFNYELLSRIFTTDEYANEYLISKGSVHVISDRYYEPSFDHIASRLVQSVTKQMESLRSIIDRLELVEGPEEVTPISAETRVAQGENGLEMLAERFHLVARQIKIRRKARPTLEVNDEYDVQDLFHGLLNIFYDDIRKEEWVPSYAGGATKMDFLLPTLDAAVELKKSRSNLSTKDLGEQLLIDIAKYEKHPKCRRLYCVVYDPDGLISNPRGVESDLNGKHGELIVRVMIVPKGH